MKVLPLLVAAVSLAACDVKNITTVEEPAATPTPAPKAAPTPKPTPKPGEWMFKNYKNPLEQKPK